MPMDPRQRSRRLAAIREIIDSESVSSQTELAGLLMDRGFSVTQSSISRDLRSLPVSKVNGAYCVSGPGPSRPEGAELQETIRDAVVGVAQAGPNLVVVRTVIGGASRLGSVIDHAAWPEIVGTVAGDDTLFVAVSGQRAAKALTQRLSDSAAEEAKEASDV